MIILEGPDGSGKTTLASELAKQFNLLYEHSGPPVPTENLFRTYQGRLQNSRPNTVFDRLFHGELVYGPIMRGSSRLDEVQTAFLELEAATAGAWVIWCMASPAELKMRGDPIYQKVDPRNLLRGYETISSRSQLRCLLHSSTIPGSIGKTIDMLRQVHYEPRAMRWPYPGVGSPDFAEVAIIGEKHPGKWPTVWERELKQLRPFDTSTSGRFLMEALISLPDYCPSRVYITNAEKQGHGGSLMEELICLPRLKRIVCLGENAHREVQRRICQPYENPLPNIEVYKVPHPQFYKRFMSSEKAKYRDLLAVACGWRI